MTKYNNTKTKGYDSRKEYLRSLELKQMQKNGIIYGLEEQKIYELIPKQNYRGKFAEHPCRYVADFVYWMNGDVIVEDVKGMKTEVYRIKKKLMLHVHGIKIKEV
jgi:hypothetical protein